MITQQPTCLRGLQVVVFNTVIALITTYLAGHRWWINFVFSQCIGLCIWGLIDYGQFFLIRNFEKQWPRILLIVPLGAVLGHWAGLQLAGGLVHWLYPGQTLSYWSIESNRTLGFLVISLTAGAAITYFFMSREQLSRAREEVAASAAQAQALQRQAVEAQLKLLQTQLEPHMLFNTLANLRALIALDPLQAQGMIDHLVAYLRSTLGASRAASHTLQEEFDHLRDYLELMKLRMGSRLGYVLDLPAELARVPIPPLLLQPLVENAIKHGLEPKVSGGHVLVSARRVADQLKLEVLDTGVGLPAVPVNRFGFGLTQVRERLLVTHGSLARVDLELNPQGGTRVQLLLPEPCPS